MKLTKEHLQLIETLETTPVFTDEYFSKNPVIKELEVWGLLNVRWHFPGDEGHVEITEAGRYIIEIESKKLLDLSV